MHYKRERTHYKSSKIQTYTTMFDMDITSGIS